MADEEVLEEGDPAVPSDLLELHVELEEQGMTPDDFKEKMNENNS